MMNADKTVLYSGLPQDDWENKPKCSKVLSNGPSAAKGSAKASRKSYAKTLFLIVFVICVVALLLVIGFHVFEIPGENYFKFWGMPTGQTQSSSSTNGSFPIKTNDVNADQDKEYHLQHTLNKQDEDVNKEIKEVDLTLEPSNIGKDNSETTIPNTSTTPTSNTKITTNTGTPKEKYSTHFTTIKTTTISDEKPHTGVSATTKVRNEIRDTTYTATPYHTTSKTRPPIQITTSKLEMMTTTTVMSPSATLLLDNEQKPNAEHPNNILNSTEPKINVSIFLFYFYGRIIDN